MTPRVRDEPDWDVHVFEPHQAGLPPMRRYLTDLWRRRDFAYQMARSSLKAQHFDTFFGQLWVVLNPLLLALVYFFLVTVLRGGHDDPLGALTFLVGGLFLYYFTRNAIGQGASSVVGGGGLLMNTAFPRAVLPLSSTITALLLFLPTLVVYAIFHVASEQPITWGLLALPVLFSLLTLFNLGLALAAGALTVYFRDTSSFLPYLLRIWLYLSPILWLLEDAPEAVRPVLVLNPLVSYLTAWQNITFEGVMPDWQVWVLCLVWAVGAIIVGGWFFLSREREFAIRV
jgi:ABC-type polysaccharide/polyol phosphate export permease